MPRQVDIEDIKKLPIDARLVLIESIWQSIVDEKRNFAWTRTELKRLMSNLSEIGPTPKLTSAQLRELRRRLEEIKEHPERLIPWEKVKTDLDAKLRKIKSSRNTARMSKK